MSQDNNTAYALDRLAEPDESRPYLTLIEGGRSCVGVQPAAMPPARHVHESRVVSQQVPERHTAPSLGLRQLVAVALVSIFAAASLLFISSSVSAAHASFVADTLSSVTSEQVVVGSGDSLWTIAEEHPVDGLTTQETADWIASTNGLSTSALSIGQHLSVASTR